MTMQRNGFAPVVIVLIVALVLAGIGGYLAFHQKASAPSAPQTGVTFPQPPTASESVSATTSAFATAAVSLKTPTVTYVNGSKPSVQINFDYTQGSRFTLYRASSAQGPWIKFIADFPASAHTAVDYGPFYAGQTEIFYRIVVLNTNGTEGAAFPLVSIRLSDTARGSLSQQVRVNKPTVTFTGRNLVAVKVWGWPTGTEVTQPVLLGAASLQATAGDGTQTWIWNAATACQQGALLVTNIDAEGYQYDAPGGIVGKTSLSYTGASEISEVLCP